MLNRDKKSSHIIKNLLYKIVWNFSIFLLFIYLKFRFGFKVKGKQNLKNIIKEKQKFIVVSNHIHTLDSAMIAVSLYPTIIRFTSLKSNFDSKYIGKVLRFFKTIPIENNVLKLSHTFELIYSLINNYKVVHFFPEGKLIMYNEKLEEFNKGAFMCAYNTGALVVPVVLTISKRKGFFKVFNSTKKCFTANILTEEKIDFSLNKKQSIIELTNRVKDKMLKVISINK